MRSYGRQEEARRIDSLIDSARVGRSGALVLSGARGIGKTELLGSAIDGARGMTVLFACGLEAETPLAFSALADVLRPILGLLDEIPDPQASALAGALGLGPAVAVGPFVMCAATLSLLSAAARAQPVLVAVDDWQWIDDASKQALLFAARRLDSQPIAFLIALSDDAAHRLSATELEDLVVAASDRDRGACEDVLELTPHELELAVLVGRGATNKEASAALFISPKTVEAHLHRIYVKLGLRSRTELAHRLARLRMLD
ncbi:MAG TPA: LuxR family transcriptional regulator [Gaiellaceae bacterium]|nr:LuxR family transcriptional regulator [Gaiellaceae bacterium]